jgi:hypothetical protein
MRAFNLCYVRSLFSAKRDKTFADVIGKGRAGRSLYVGRVRGVYFNHADNTFSVDMVDSRGRHMYITDVKYNGK